MEDEELQGAARRPARRGWLKGLLFAALMLLALAAGSSFLGFGTGDPDDAHPGRGSVIVESGGGVDSERVPGSAPGAGLFAGGARGQGREEGKASAGEEPAADPGKPALPASETMVRSDGSESAASRAFVFDAVSGAAVAGASVRLTWFHGSTDLSRAGLSPLAAVVHHSGEDGGFGFPIVLPEDPRLRAHVQINHPDYSPEVCVLHGRMDSRGRWTKVEAAGDTPDLVVLGGRTGGPGTGSRIEFYVRRTLTVPLTVLGPDGGGLANAPLAVRPWVDDHSFLDEAEVEFAWSGRLVRPGPWRVLYTDERGSLRLPFSDAPWELELLHPLYFLHGRPRPGFPEAIGRQRILLQDAREFVLEAEQGHLAGHRLVDLDGRPLAECEIEVELEGMPPLRTRTDPSGWFELGIHPFPQPSPLISFANRRAGRLTVLSPRYWNRSMDITLPIDEPELLLEARAASFLDFRLVSREGEGAPAVAPDALRTTLDMTLMRLGANGEVSYCGIPPPAGSKMGVLQSGYLPVSVWWPESPQRFLSHDIDLGELSLIRGWTREVHLEGASPEGLATASLSVSSIDGVPAGFDGLEVHRYEPGADGRVRIGGLQHGEYLLSVDGPLLGSLARRVTIFEENLDEPIVMPLQLSGEELVTVSGLVAGLGPFETRGVTVVERYFISGREEALAMPPYPLSREGVFGSIRKLSGVEAVEVSISTTGDRGEQVLLSRGEGPPKFEFGELRLRRPPKAVLEFYTPGYPAVWPPLNPGLEGESGSEVSSRFRLSGHLLVIDNLRMGRYVLRWKGFAGEEESYLFDVPNKFGGEIRGRVKRRLLPLEVIEIDVVDSRGGRVEGARVLQEDTLLPPGLGPGHPALENRLFVTVTTRQETSFSVEAPGFLPAFVRVPPGEVVPLNIVLYRDITRVVGRVLDTGGEPFSGILEIDWTPLTPAVTRHGQPLLVEVLNGRLRADGLLPQPRDFIFRPKDSSSFLRRRLALPEERRLVDLGVLRLGETRAIKGFVYLGDGSPAPGVVVALLPIADAYRYPGVDPVDFKRLQWKTKTDEKGGFELGELPLVLPPRWALIAQLDGFSDSVEEDPVLGLPSRELFLEPEAVLEVNIGYLNEPEGDHYAFSLEFQADPADPGSRVDLGELPPEFFGLHRFEGVRPGQYRVKWGLRDAYEPIPPVWQDVFLPAGGLGRLDFIIEGLVVRGRAELNGLPVEKGWVILTHNPGENGGARVGRVVDGEFELIDPPKVLRAWAAVIPEEKDQTQQNIYRGEALPVEVRNYRSALRSGFLEVVGAGYDLRLELDRDLLLRNPGATLSFDHWEWDGRRFRAVEDSELIESSRLSFGLLLPGSYRFTIRSETGSLLRQFTVPLKGADLVVPIR